VLSLGLAVIFGLLNIVNFAHGSQFTAGAFLAWLGLGQLGSLLGMPDLAFGYFSALFLVPVIVGLLGVVFERTMLKRLYQMEPEYGLLLTFGLALVVDGMFRQWFGISGKSYEVPEVLSGIVRFESLEVALPKYRLFAVAISLSVCLVVWWAIEKTKLGALLRAGTENPKLLQAFGVNVPMVVTVTYGLGVALAAFAGVVAAPVYQVSPMMGTNMIIVVIAVVVIGGIGSVGGSIVTGVGLGLVEALTKVIYAPASSVVIFAVMALVLLLRPAGLFGKEA
jgi:branched-chain amino acid transport system permease protein